tara:strand:- start:188 stop:1210 length:1023 start_codon:yes stop_codon:yes gene_type:complete
MKHLLISLTAAVAVCAANDKPLDFWDEEIRLFSVAKSGQALDVDLAKRRESNYTPRGFSLDHADYKAGDLSVAYAPAKAGMPTRFGFVAGLWGETWNLSPEANLKLWIKSENLKNSKPWKVKLVDFQGLETNGELAGISAEWQELTLPLSTLKADDGFDWTQVKLCEFTSKLGQEALVHFDGIRFETGDVVIGVTDKTVVQRMAEAQASRALRTKTALKATADNKKEGLYAPVAAFAKMMLNEDLETANQMLVDELKLSSDANAWSLLHTPLYCRFYYMFSNSHGKFPGRMTPETEKLLLETLWNRTSAKNDIHWARQSTWYLDGSENHDLNAKAYPCTT